MLVAGYNLVTMIPAGATQLDIRQHGHQQHQDDDNYLGQPCPWSLSYVQYWPPCQQKDKKKKKKKTDREKEKTGTRQKKKTLNDSRN